MHNDTENFELTAPPIDLPARRRRGGALARKHAERYGEREVVIPECEHPERRAAAEAAGAKVWMETYLGRWFRVAWSKAHLEAIALFEKCLTYGDVATECLPRGSGKTTLANGLVLFCVLTRTEQFVLLLAADAPKAKSMLADIKGELEGNELLMEDYPEACAPIRALDGHAQRAKAQLHDGQPLHLAWRTDFVMLPSVDGKPCCGNAIAVSGIDGGLRGRNVRNPHTGARMRPSFVYLDDFVKDKEARSRVAQDALMATIRQGVLSLGGHDKSTATFITCTILAQNDAADRITDAKVNPEFHAVKYPAFLRWPDALETLWKEYAAMHREEDEKGQIEHAGSTEFYRRNQAQMDAGCEIYWDIKQEHEVSAIQHFMNKYITLGRAVFLVEFQHQPEQATAALFYDLRPEHVLKRLSGRPSLVCADRTGAVVVAADVNRYGLSWTMLAGDTSGAAEVVAYGVHTAGGAPLFDPERPTESEELAVYRALDDLIRHFEGVQVLDVSGRRRKIEAVGIDCGYMTRTIERFVMSRWAPFSLVALRGRASQYYRDGGTKVVRRGDCWAVADLGDGRKQLVFDSDRWREGTQQAWLLPAGAPGGLLLHGREADAQWHADFSQQVTCERLIDKAPSSTGTGWFYKWAQNGRNDLGDALGMARVLLSYFGCGVALTPRPPAADRASSAAEAAAIVPAPPPPAPVRQAKSRRQWVSYQPM